MAYFDITGDNKDNKKAEHKRLRLKNISVQRGFSIKLQKPSMRPLPNYSVYLKDSRYILYEIQE